MSSAFADYVAMSEASHDDLAGDGDASTPPDLAVATQVLGTLTERQRKMVLEVLQRDEQVRRMDATRMM